MAREVQRSVLPIPDQPSFGLVTYDARDPDTRFPPIEPLRPAPGCTERPGSIPPRCARRPARRC
jgi:hypothetical protein